MFSPDILKLIETAGAISMSREQCRIMFTVELFKQLGASQTDINVCVFNRDGVTVEIIVGFDRVSFMSDTSPSSSFISINTDTACAASLLATLQTHLGNAALNS